MFRNLRSKVETSETRARRACRRDRSSEYHACAPTLGSFECRTARSLRPAHREDRIFHFLPTRAASSCSPRFAIDRATSSYRWSEDSTEASFIVAHGLAIRMRPGKPRVLGKRIFDAALSRIAFVSILVLLLMHNMFAYFLCWQRKYFG